jgi:hypothetical protein
VHPVSLAPGDLDEHVRALQAIDELSCAGRRQVGARQIRSMSV